MSIKPLATDNLSTRAYTSLRSALIDGDFAPGERLVIQDIAERFGTSVTPVREACLRLVSEQGLELRSGRFLTVPNLDLGRYLEIRKMRIA
ncbi:MAG: GntR family transcriptional regulator, partial [Rhizobiaceae bacterium]|nr:GntR family transcriptional regulator [Rhizobiaceae bacterium]